MKRKCKPELYIHHALHEAHSDIKLFVERPAYLFDKKASCQLRMIQTEDGIQ